MLFDGVSASARRLAATKKPKLGELELAACKTLGSGCRDVVRVWARESTMHRARVSVRGSPGPPRVRAARSRVTRAAPSSGVNLRRAPPREAVRLRQALLRDADTKLRLLAVLCVPTKGPRLRAHRLVRASGRAAAGAAQPAGTMAPFARNDKTILEIALPALVGFNASVS